MTLTLTEIASDIAHKVIEQLDLIVEPDESPHRTIAVALQNQVITVDDILRVIAAENRSRWLMSVIVDNKILTASVHRTWAAANRSWIDYVVANWSPAWGPMPDPAPTDRLDVDLLRPPSPLTRHYCELSGQQVSITLINN